MRALSGNIWLFNGRELKDNGCISISKKAEDPGRFKTPSLSITHLPGFEESVELLGFEPRQTEPKSVVLPLHHSSIPLQFLNWDAKIRVDRFPPKCFLLRKSIF